jgi:hypothetical protein
MNETFLIHRVAVGGADIGSTLVRAYRITNVGIHPNVRLDIRLRLIAITDQSVPEVIIIS